MQKPIRVLITGAGAPGIRGTSYALRTNPDHAPVVLGGIDINPNAVGKFFLDEFYTVPEPEHPAYQDRLVEAYKSFNADLLLPQTTRETEYLAANRDRLEGSGINTLVPSKKVIEVSNNKIETIRQFERIGLRVPKYRSVRNDSDLLEACAALNYPNVDVVVKVPVSNGKRGFRILSENQLSYNDFLSQKPSGDKISLSSFRQMMSTVNEWPELLVTEFLPGAEYSVDAFRGEHVNIAIPRIRERIRSGISFDNRFVKSAELIQATRDFADSIGMRGIFGIQYKEDRDGRPTVLECNPRIQGTMVASCFCGANLIWFGVREALGYPYRIAPTIKWDVAFRRYWGGIGISDDKATNI